MNRESTFAKQLEPKLKPLYQRLIEEVKELPGPKVTFAAQWGKYYPEGANEGILFVGRATNSWRTTEEDINVLFGDPKLGSTIFNCDDQMTWVYDCWNGKGYATKRSAFWRVIRSVAGYFYETDELNHVAWSNICKIQEDYGNNPRSRLFDKQINTCKEIFKTELDVLSPKIVVMFIGDYGKEEMLSYMNGGEMPQEVESVEWSTYKTKVYNIGKIIYLCSEHPMCKDETTHINCLKSLIQKYK